MFVLQSQQKLMKFFSVTSVKLVYPLAIFPVYPLPIKDVALRDKAFVP